MEEIATTTPDGWEKFVSNNAVRCNECPCAPPAPGKLECLLCHANHVAGLQRILEDLLSKEEYAAKFILTEEEVVAGLAWFNSCVARRHEAACKACPWGKSCNSLIKKLLRARELIENKKHEKK